MATDLPMPDELPTHIKFALASRGGNYSDFTEIDASDLATIAVRLAVAGRSLNEAAKLLEDNSVVIQGWPLLDKAVSQLTRTASFIEDEVRFSVALRGR